MAKKVVTQAKKPQPKKLTKSSDLFSDMMAAGGGAVKSKPGPASKKLPVPKKPLGQSQKHKKSESESDQKPVKKKPKKVVSDSEDDMFDAGPPGPPGPRSKTGKTTLSYLVIFLNFLFVVFTPNVNLGGRSKQQVK